MLERVMIRRLISVLLISGIAGVWVAVMIDRQRYISAEWIVIDISGMAAILGTLSCTAITPRKGLPALIGPQLAFNMHRALGYVSVGVVVLHIGASFWFEPLVLRSLSLLSTRHAWSGAIAAAMLAVCVALTFARPRARVYADGRDFRIGHGFLAILIVALSLYHAVPVGIHLYRTILGAVILIISCATVLRVVIPMGQQRNFLLVGRVRLLPCIVAMGLIVAITLIIPWMAAK